MPMSSLLHVYSYNDCIMVTDMAPSYTVYTIIYPGIPLKVKQIEYCIVADVLNNTHDCLCENPPCLYLPVF